MAVVNRPGMFRKHNTVSGAMQSPRIPRANSPLQSALNETGISHEDFEEGSEARNLLRAREELVRRAIKEDAERQVDDMINTGYDFTGQNEGHHLNEEDIEKIKTAEDHLEAFDQAHAMTLLKGKSISLSLSLPENYLQEDLHC